MADLIRLVVVDDDPLVRVGLRMILEGSPGIDLVGEAGDGHAALAAVAEHAPDVVLMDIRMPGMDGLTATEHLRGAADGPEVVVLTTFDADEQVLRALRAGAAGFLLKDTPPAEIVRAVELVAGGAALLSPSVTRRLLARLADTDGASRRRAAQAQLDRLTERELEVALALGQGQTNAEISRGLHMSVPTVKAHVSRILAELALNNRVQVALIVHDAERA